MYRMVLRSGKEISAVKICVHFFFYLLSACLLCGCSLHEGDFGSKFCAVYKNYDSAERFLRSYLNTKEERKPRYRMFLAVAEMYRGNIKEMHKAFSRAEQEQGKGDCVLLLLRCNWYLENSDSANAREDLKRLKQLLADPDHPVRYDYYSYLLVCNILEQRHAQLWQKISERSYRNFLLFAAERLEEKWDHLQRSGRKGLWALHNIKSPAVKQAAFGMKEEHLRTLLGAEQIKIDLDHLDRRILVYFLENHLIGFYFTWKVQRLGQVRVFPACKRHGYSPMRLKRSVSPLYFKRNKILYSSSGKFRSDHTFCYTPDHDKAEDFNWICLKCLHSP